MATHVSALGWRVPVEMPGASGSAERAEAWNRDHPGGIPLESYQKPDGTWAERLSMDGLDDYGILRDHRTGTVGMPDGSRPAYGFMNSPGVLMDGNGHYWDAHDLPAGLAFVDGQKAPSVRDGYVMAPDGCVWDEKALSSGAFLSGDGYSRDWSYDGAGRFTDKANGGIWKYDAREAVLMAERDLAAARPATDWRAFAQPAVPAARQAAAKAPAWKNVGLPDVPSVGAGASVDGPDY